MAEMAFALQGELLVVVHNECAPAQTRWEEFCRECHRSYVELPGAETGAVLVASDGGGPDVVQRAQLLKAVERIPVRTAVVSPSVGVRRIHAALQLFNEHARCFDVPEWRDAMLHLGINPRQYGDLARTLAALCEVVPRAITAQTLRNQLADEHRRHARKLDSGIQGKGPAASGPIGLFQRIRRGA